MEPQKKLCKLQSSSPEVVKSNRQDELASSCKKECKADAARKGCLSCGRTMEEITLAGLRRKDEKLDRT